MGAYFKYAWAGSGPYWHTAKIAICGGLPGGALFYLLGLRVPHEILDNPLWGPVAGIVLCAIAGVCLVFFVRLLWAPIHFRLEAGGGLSATLRAKLGDQMWPVAMMATGLVAFVILFGGGAIWFITQLKRPDGSIPPSNTVVAYEIEHQLRGIDEVRKVLVTVMPSLSEEGRDIASKIEGDIQRGTLDGKSASVELLAYAQKAEAEIVGLQRFMETFRDYNYMRRPFGGFLPFNPFELVASSRNLAKELREFPSGVQYLTLLNNRHMIAFSKSAIEIRNWAGQVDEEFGRARKQVLTIPAVQPAPAH